MLFFLLFSNLNIVAAPGMLVKSVCWCVGISSSLAGFSIKSVCWCVCLGGGGGGGVCSGSVS